MALRTPPDDCKTTHMTKRYAVSLGDGTVETVEKGTSRTETLLMVLRDLLQSIGREINHYLSWHDGLICEITWLSSVFMCMCVVLFANVMSQ